MDSEKTGETKLVTIVVKMWVWHVTVIVQTTKKVYRSYAVTFFCHVLMVWLEILRDCAMLVQRVVMCTTDNYMPFLITTSLMRALRAGTAYLNTMHEIMWTAFIIKKFFF